MRYHPSYEYDSADCDEGDIQLVGGSGQEEGIVLLCLSSLWGMVAYDEQWDGEEAHVLCSQLGYEPKGIVHIGNSELACKFCPSIRWSCA